MNKYVIELGKDVKSVQSIIVTPYGNVYTHTEGIANLEELNSDYINEHYGSLQDEAYQRGLNDAWEAARKIADMWETMDIDDLLETFGVTAKIGESVIGTLFKKQTANEAMLELKAYEEKQKAEDDIKLGDVLEHTVSGYTSKAIFLEKIEDDEDWYKCLFWTGCGLAILSYPKSQFKRTGRHFDIASILEDMRND